jgi:hypothetical protein
VRRTLRRFDQHDPDRRGRRLASAALEALLDALPVGRRHALVDYFAYLDAAEIALPDAGQDVFERYLHRLATRRLKRGPAARAGQVASAWNWARTHLHGWPPVALVPPCGRAVGPGLEACPASFHQDLHPTSAVSPARTSAIPSDLRRVASVCDEAYRLGHSLSSSCPRLTIPDQKRSILSLPRLHRLSQSRVITTLSASSKLR